MVSEEGIRIDNAALELSGPGLEALLAGRGVDITLHRLDGSISEASLNQLLARGASPRPRLESAAPEAAVRPPDHIGIGTAPRIELRPGDVVVETSWPDRDGAPVRIRLRFASLRLEVEAGVLRVRSE
ncbi:MAG: hypothetical protein HY320_08275 [Armatimonadetes bacterium]|nr:hypothetical protein [Armatimonadota bacterium]